jgi:hypothetical protein
MFCILDHIKAREILDPVEKFTDWERFQSLASALVSPRVELIQVWEPSTVQNRQLPPCSKTGDIYRLQIVA